MSFSADVKKELVNCFPNARHCQLAEIRAFVQLLGNTAEIKDDDDFHGLWFRFEHVETSRKLFTLLIRAFKIDVTVSEAKTRGGKSAGYYVEILDPDDAALVRKAISHPSVLSAECCRKSFLRGAFLASGSLSAPEKYYHFEIVCPDASAAELVQSTMKSIGVDARIVVRKKDYVCYIKEGDLIVSMLGAMGASISFLNIENIRVMKEMRGNINRKVNCETANLNKTVVSAVRQIEDIRYIRDHAGFGDLSSALKSIAEVRIEHPQASLQELGDMVEPRIGKSGVNHRLRKLSQIAEEMRLKQIEEE